MLLVVLFDVQKFVIFNILLQLAFLYKTEHLKDFIHSMN